MAESGRKINADQLVKLLRHGFSRSDCADFFECSESAIKLYVKKNFGTTFDELKKKHRVAYKLKLMDNLEKMSDDNASVLIFLAKSELGLNENSYAPTNEESEKTFDSALRKASRLIGNSKDLVSVPDRLDDDAEED